MLREIIKTCQKKVKKVWGKEYWIVNNPDYCGKLLVLHKQYRCSMHHHEEKKETFLVVSGKILLEAGVGRDFILSPGMSMTIPLNMSHRFTGLEPTSEIIEFSSQHFEHDSYRQTKSEKVPDDEWKRIINEQ